MVATVGGALPYSLYKVLGSDEPSIPTQTLTLTKLLKLKRD